MRRPTTSEDQRAPRVEVLLQEAPSHLRVRHERHPQRGLHDRVRALEAGRRHADDRERAAVERDGLADDRGSPPSCRCQNAYDSTVTRLLAGHAVLVRAGSARPSDGRHAEHVEEVPAHDLADDLLRLAGAGERERDAVVDRRAR